MSLGAWRQDNRDQMQARENYVLARNPALRLRCLFGLLGYPNMRLWCKSGKLSMDVELPKFLTSSGVGDRIPVFLDTLVII